MDRVIFTHWYKHLRSDYYRRFYSLRLNFFRELLSKDCDLVFDIGANSGDYTFIFSKFARKVVAIEPDMKNYRVLTSRFSTLKNVEILNKAVSDKNGYATFHIEKEGSAYNTLSDKWVDILESESKSRIKEKKFAQSYEVETHTVNKLIEVYGKPDFIKIDVEGFEKEVIEGLTQPVKLISVECNLPEFLSETIFIVNYVSNLSADYSFNYTRNGNFLLDKFISAADMIEFLKVTDVRFMEIYCKLGGS